ncbi:MAG: alpha/beta hydrolase [Patescibacteria group bacterium]
MKIIIKGLAINYSDLGPAKTKTVLLLHGWGSNLHTFDNLAEKLKNDFRVVVLDFAGFGESELPREIWGVGEYANLVKSFLNKINIKPDFIIAHSFGGRVAIKLVGLGLCVPEKLVLIGAAGPKIELVGKQKIFSVLAKTFSWVLRLPIINRFRNKVRHKIYNHIGSTDYISAGPLQKIFIKVVNEDLTDLARNINRPTMLIWGDKDQDSPLATGKILNQLIKGSQLEVIPETGHFVHEEQAEVVGEIVTKFLK